MSTPAASPDQTRHAVPANSPLDEAVWQAWVRKGRSQQERSRTAWRKAVKFLSLAGLLFAVVAGFWPQLLAYDAAVRFIVAAGATLLMFQAFTLRYYAVGTMFGALALLYNPMAPIFSFSGNWQRALVVLSVLPFVASLTWRNVRLVTNENR